MVFAEVFRPFIEKSAVSVMFRGTLENVFSAERLDRLFEKTAQKQHCRELTFSACAHLLGLVVTQVRSSVNAAYRADAAAVSVQSVYRKLAGIEPAVCEAFVRETASDLGSIVDAMQADLPGSLPGFQVRIVDGNHLQGTHHKLKELRRLGDAARPGHTLAVLNPHRQLIEDVVVCLDAHANQKPLFRRLFASMQPKQCWIGDRDFSTRDFLFGVAERGAYFLVRQHGQLQVESCGPQRKWGRTPTDVVYEQAVRLCDADGRSLQVRRITVMLDKPTRDKDVEIHILTNLPKKVTARKIAAAYLSRWSIEAAFHKLTMVLRCELDTLGYPQAALFGFCLAVAMYNAVSVVMAALRAAHLPVAAESAAAPTASPASAHRKISFYYVADEIAGVWRGMEIVIDAEQWAATFANQTPRQMAKKLLYLARQVNIARYLANPSGVKRRKKRRIIQHGGHVSTYRILQQRKNPAKKMSP